MGVVFQISVDDFEKGGDDPEDSGFSTAQMHAKSLDFNWISLRFHCVWRCRIRIGRNILPGKSASEY